MTNQWILSAAVLGYALVLCGCGAKKPVPSDEVAGPLVSATVVEAAGPLRKLTLSGQVRARNETALAFRIAGKVERRLVDAGQTVEAGTPLCVLDKSDYLLKLDAMNAQEDAAQSRFDNACDELARHRRMLAQKFVSQAQFDRVQSSYDQAEAALNAAASARANAENDMQYTTLTAGSRAIVAELLAEVGQVVAAGQPVLNLAALDQMESELYIPEKYAAQVLIGDAVEVDCSFAGLGKLTGRIREIAGSADQRTRTFRARAALDAVPEKLRLGMSVNVALSVPMPAGSVLAPSEAVCDGRGEAAQVWVVGADGVAAPREVKVCGMQDGKLAVQGLNAGERIVVSGARFLMAPQKVRIVGNGAEANAPQ